MNRFIPALIAVLALLPFQAGAQETFGGGLSPGDQLRIIVWRNPELSGDFPIAANGTVTHPIYREVQVTGVPMATVEERLRTFLTRYITNPQFVIIALVRIVMGGEVRAPNLYSVPPETTITQAIALAGGSTEFANLRKVRILRDGQEVVVDLTRADEKAGLLQIRSGDQILIPRNRNIFRDVVGPAASTAGLVVGITNIFIRRR
jgi:polysaccharide export outer membrane protein